MDLFEPLFEELVLVLKVQADLHELLVALLHELVFLGVSGVGFFRLFGSVVKWLLASGGGPVGVGVAEEVLVDYARHVDFGAFLVEILLNG